MFVKLQIAHVILHRVEIKKQKIERYKRESWLIYKGLLIRQILGDRAD